MGKRAVIAAFFAFAAALSLNAQRVELVPFGDFENWVVRDIQESKIIGGETKRIYNIAPTDTIVGNVAYMTDKSFWCTSNTYAKVAGVNKASLSVEPDYGPTGRCAKLSSCFAGAKALGVIDIQVLVSGSIYWGKAFEPITSTKDPYSYMDWGIPFTERPDALVIDYKAVVPNSGTLTKGTTNKQTTFPGYDHPEIMFVLQHRWEAEDGTIHAWRVGTAAARIPESSDGWVQGYRVPVEYGESSDAVKEIMPLNREVRPFYTYNSKGKPKLIKEEGYRGDLKPTHAILMITTGQWGAFIGATDNILWLDNISLEYAE